MKPKNFCSVAFTAALAGTAGLASGQLLQWIRTFNGPASGTDVA